jgi:hypothetical protein
MWHAPPKSAGCRTCHIRWSFHLKCGEDHDGCRQIHSVLTGLFGSHLGLCDPVHARHYMLNDQCFEFLSDAFLVAVLFGPGELNNPRYTFPAAYRDAKASGC